MQTLFSTFLPAIPFSGNNPTSGRNVSPSASSTSEIGHLLPPRGLSSPPHRSLWTTRDLLTKIAKKNTFHRPFLSRCLNARAIFQLPYDHSEHEHSCQQRTRKQESPCEFDLTEDRFVTSLQVENRSPTAQKGKGHFPTLIPEASSSYMKSQSTWRNEMDNQWYAFEITSFGQVRQGHDDNDSVKSHVTVLSFHSDHKPQKGQEGSNVFPKSTPGPTASFYKWANPDSTAFPARDCLREADPGTFAEAGVFINKFTAQDVGVYHNHPDYVTCCSLRLPPSHDLLGVIALVTLSFKRGTSASSVVSLLSIVFCVFGFFFKC